MYSEQNLPFVGYIKINNHEKNLYLDFHYRNRRDVRGAKKPRMKSDWMYRRQKPKLFFMQWQCVWN